MKKMMKDNITLEQYKEIVENAKATALSDLNSSDALELQDSEEPAFSALTVKLRCRDDEDSSWVIGYDIHTLFLRFEPDLMEYIREESTDLLENDEPDKESARDRLYWEVTKYAKIKNVMCKMYDAYFSLSCELLGVHWSCRLELYDTKLYPDLRRYELYPEENIKLSDVQSFLLNSSEQLYLPLNVELPYQPGDILYIDRRPAEKPLYAVYCAETDGDEEYFEWTLSDYGFYKRVHPCLYISEDDNSLDFMQLTTGDISYPYTQLDHIKVVEKCDDLRLMKASCLLKKAPNLYRTWLTTLEENAKKHKSESLEHIVLDRS